MTHAEAHKLPPGQRWVIVDTETDGLTAPIHVIEIAAQLMEGSQPCGDPFQIYLNHDVPIPAEATAIHGYTREFLQEHGQTPIEAHEAFRQYARDYPIVAHNLAYDWNRALEPEWTRLGLPTIGQRGFCTLLLSRRVIAGLASFRLDVLKRHFCLNEGQSHKALNDVQTVVKLFTTIIKPRLEFAGLITFPQWVDFSRQQPISKCLLQTNPKQNTDGAKIYYLDSKKLKNYQQKTITHNSATEIESQTPDKVSIAGRHFCFTGKAAFGTRAECEKAVVERGGTCEKHPHFNTDYLVIGSLGSPSSKLEEAEELRRRGEPIALITEQAWLAAIQQAVKIPDFLLPKPISKMTRRRLPMPATKSPYGGISLTIGIGTNGAFSKIERIPRPTSNKQTEP